MKARNLNATTFRMILLSVLTVTIIASIAATYFGQSFLRSNSESVIQAVSTEFSSKNRLEQLQKAEQVLKDHEVSMEKARNIASSSDGFAYQQQLIDDINRYAQRAGITVTGYSFAEAPSGGAAAGASAGNAAASPKSPATPGIPAGPVGMQKAAVTVSFLSPIDYETLMRFLTILDTSLPKINAESIQINRSESNPNEVNLTSLNLEVYIKQ